MNSIIQLLWFCAAGYSFFLGIAFLIAAILIGLLSKKRPVRAMVYIMALIGTFGIVLSSPAIASWFCLIWVLGGLSWAVTLSVSKVSRKIKHRFVIIFLVTSLAALSLEGSYFFSPELPQGSFDKLWIVGDSLSAGVGGPKEKVWTMMLSEEHGIEVVNLSVAGATVTTAVDQARNVQAGNAMVLVEIGGNDLFENTAIDQFEKSLNQILFELKAKQLKVLMLELPLLPGQMRYGRVQRRLAGKYEVTLIPKRFFTAVLSTEGASADIAHLTPAGHKAMAKMVWNFIKGGFERQENHVPRLSAAQLTDS